MFSGPFNGRHNSQNNRFQTGRSNYGDPNDTEPPWWKTLLLIIATVSAFALLMFGLFVL
ncbi:MAG: hypothetical protein JXQ87_14650 [Bacteroidia bacterium]